MPVSSAPEPILRAVQAEQGVDGPETISLTLPHDERFVNVARLVVGGLAARLDLLFESLDDLQLAVESVLSERRYSAGGSVTVEIEIGDGLVRMFVAPLDTDAIERDLAAEPHRIGLGVLLGAVVDSVGFEDRDGDRRCLVLEKRVPRSM